MKDEDTSKLTDTEISKIERIAESAEDFVETTMSKTTWKQKIQNLKTEVHALYLASKNPRVPWHAKVLMALIIGYAICPIDLIPDFIPVLGQLDDLIIVPAGIALVIKMIPKNVMEECRKKARDEPIDTRTKWIVALIIISIWAFVIYLVIRFILPMLF